MSEYLVSARKYRPSTFEDVVGQEHVTKTLQNAIAKKQIAHAYLFCGPRGVGKTTCARIFSQLINENTNSEYNIFELDGASNNSVDDIRNLIDQIKIPPQIGKYKTYIIDEVHMLSKSAFNAFLKTLEEPPKHSIFILATTEKEKIIPTILSRCQIFDFNRINNQQLKTYLLKLSDKENIQVQEQTIQLISEKADGSLRDALSIFDKVYTFCNTNWEHEEVSQILLSLDTKFAIQLTSNIIAKDIHACLMKINQILEKGYDGKEIIKSLISHFRNLIMTKDSKTAELIHVEKKLLEIMTNQAAEFSNNQILLALSHLNECDLNYNKSINQRFLIELCVMRLCSLSEKDLKKKLLIPLPHKNEENKEIKDTLSNKEDVKTNNNANEFAVEKADVNLNNITSKKKENNTHKLTSNSKLLDIKKDSVSNQTHQKTIESDLISITDELQAMNTENQAQTVDNNANNDWTEEKLIEKWKIFAQKLLEKQKINLYNMFDRYLPTKNNNNINVKVVSLSEQSEIEEIKLELLSFLKNELNNDFIKIIINIKEDKHKNMLHTKEEKYSYILKQNKNIKLLTEKLNLTII